MSPVSRGRKKKPAKRQRNRPVSPFDIILRSAETLLSEKMVVTAESWASEALGALWDDCWHNEFDDPDHQFSAVVEALAEHLKLAGTGAALAALRALSLVGEEWSREDFAAAADELSGVEEPSWFDGDAAEFFEAYSVSDPFGDIEAIALGYRHATGDHVIGVLVDHAADVHLLKIVVGRLSENGTKELAEVLSGGIPDATEVRRLTADEVRFRLASPVLTLLENGPDQLEAADIPIDDTHPVTGLALLQARVDALPPQGTEKPDTAPVIEQFLAEDLPDSELARSWADTATYSAVDHGRLPAQCGPLSLAYLLVVTLTQQFSISDADLDLMPDILRAWVRFTAGTDELRKRWDEVLPEILDDFLSSYRDPAAVEFRANAEELIDLRTLNLVQVS